MDINTVISTFKQKGIGASTLEKIPTYFNAETINDEDLVYLNIDGTSWRGEYAIIFILTSRYYIKLAIYEEGLAYRSQHIIQRDIKKILATENSVSIFFHGLHDAQTIFVDNYESAIKLQQRLTELREKNNFPYSNKSRHK